MVYKVKVNYLLEQLSPWNVKKHSDSDVSLMIEQLWECLQFVKVHVRVNVLNLENCNQEMCTHTFLMTVWYSKTSSFVFIGSVYKNVNIS